MQQELQQANANNEAHKQLEKLQQDFQQMQIGYQNSLAEKRETTTGYARDAQG